MAERRMFAKAIIGSARFLRMPATSRLLYYDLGMEADDDGCVEAFAVMRKTGANDDDLRVLVSKGFVRVLNEDMVSLILDWRTNNYIQKDRYHPSIYAKLIDQPSTDTECIHDVSEMDTQVRLGKVSLGEDSLGESGADKPPTPTRQSRKAFGEFGWVKLTDDEYNRLLNDLGETEVKRCIAYVDESAQTTQNKNRWRDWNLVVRKCHKQGWGLNQRQNNTGGYEHGVDRLARMYMEEYGG